MAEHAASEADRSWWGWGHTSRHLVADGIAGLRTLVADYLGVDDLAVQEPVPPAALELPAPRIEVPEGLGLRTTSDPVVRFRHAHGQSFRDVAAAFRGRVTNPPDAVVTASDPDEVERALDWAAQGGVACVPFGGGTSVVGGVTASADVGPHVSLVIAPGDDVVLELDRASWAARIHGGATGPAIEDALRPHGLSLRHFPQSWEFSTLGGWIATRAGGHYATGWTHIDDLVEQLDAVTPAGRWSSRRLPGSGAGPSPDRLLLGSEGALGVITDAWMRLVPRPTRRGRATIGFDTFGEGCRAVQALAQSTLRPANCRLLDPAEALLSGAGDGSVAVLVLGFEAVDDPVGALLDHAVAACRDHGGRVLDGPTVVEGDRTGEAEGGSGRWRETFLAAPYLRDALIQLGMIVETFETAVVWSRLDELVAAAHAAIHAAVAETSGRPVIVSTRLTHVYTDGAAPYFTVITPAADGDPVAQWDAIKAAASDALLAHGGTITHHHAVGRDHVPWARQQRPDLFGEVLAAAKATLDPAGVLNPGVLGLD